MSFHLNPGIQKQMYPQEFMVRQSRQNGQIQDQEETPFQRIRWQMTKIFVFQPLFSICTCIHYNQCKGREGEFYKVGKILFMDIHIHTAVILVPYTFSYIYLFSSGWIFNLCGKEWSWTFRCETGYLFYLCSVRGEDQHFTNETCTLLIAKFSPSVLFHVDLNWRVILAMYFRK